MRYVWVDGKLVPEREAVIPILTHALHYGTSVFEGIRPIGAPRAITYTYSGLGTTMSGFIIQPR